MANMAGQVYSVSTHMPLARHDILSWKHHTLHIVSTHMPLARHDRGTVSNLRSIVVSTHMPLARHDRIAAKKLSFQQMFLLTCLLRGMTS